MGKKFLRLLLVVLVSWCFSTAVSAAIVINEFDYDQPGTDDAEFVELFNNGVAAVSLDGFMLSLINGATGSSYRSVDLSGFVLAPGDYLVACGNMAAVANCAVDMGANTNRMQNDTEAIALFDGAALVDSVSYEGVVAGYTEGLAGTLADSNSEEGVSISRLLNGIDTNDNALDFAWGCATPGAMNVASNGDCAAVSTVPVPAAVWLLGTGLACLAGFMRRRGRGIISPAPV